MAQGPNETRFRTSLHGASFESVDDASLEWRRCAELLNVVAHSLDGAAKADQKIGGQTGPAMGAAFRRTSKSMGERAGLLREGSGALQSAARVIEKAQKARDAMDKAHPATSDPGSWKRPVGPLTKEDLEAQTKHQQRVKDYQEAYAARERISQQWAQNIDDVFADSTEVMKKIHGEPDPVEPPDDDDRVGPGRIDPTTGSPQGPRNYDDHSGDDDHSNDLDDDHDDHVDDHDDHTDDGTDDHDSHDQDDSGDSGDDPQHFPPVSTEHDTDRGGLSTGTLGGLAAGAGGGALALGGLRGGLQLPSALSSNGVRPIGSTGRIGTSGALTRTGAVAPGSPVTRPGATGVGRGAGGLGRGTGGVGSGAVGNRSGRAGAGGRGAGRGARPGVGGLGTGRGTKKDEEKKQAPRDLFDDGEDWIDDEGAAPDVLS